MWNSLRDGRVEVRSVVSSGTSFRDGRVARRTSDMACEIRSETIAFNFKSNLATKI